MDVRPDEWIGTDEGNGLSAGWIDGLLDYLDDVCSRVLNGFIDAHEMFKGLDVIGQVISDRNSFWIYRLIGHV